MIVCLGEKNKGKGKKGEQNYFFHCICFNVSSKTTQ